MDKQGFYSQLSPAMIRIELDSYPDKIANQKTAVRTARKNFEEVDEDRATRELEIMADITIATDPNTGKPVFSNDKARQAELAKRCRTDADYQISARLSKEAELKLNQAQDELERLENKYRSCRYRAELAAAELHFWAGKESEENLHQAY